MTKSEVIAADVSALLRARNPLLWIVTREEGRVEQHLFRAVGKAGYVPRTWDVGQGVVDMGGKPFRFPGQEPDALVRDPGEILTRIDQRAKARPEETDRCAWILRDLPPWLNGPMFAGTVRQVRNLCRTLPGIARDTAQALIVISACQ